MLEGKAIVGETDMLEAMQQDALNLAAKALDSFDVTEATDIARFIKKVQLDLFLKQFLHYPIICNKIELICAICMVMCKFEGLNLILV